MWQLAKRIRQSRSSAEYGFTLLELIIVITILVILSTLVVPIYSGFVHQAKETTLKDTLFKMRDAIDKYTLDKEEAPETLEDLVKANYLREVPVDPITGKSDSWEVELEEEPVSRKGTRGIKNVYSGAPGESSSGKPYKDF
jgi:general secretion pathway protein G